MNIKKEIEYYIENINLSGALLLSGEWGCGKTFLINELKEHFNESGYQIISISLFGLKSIEDMEKQIKQNILSITTIGKESKHNSNKNRFKEIASTLSQYSKTAKAINTVLSINILDFVKIEKSIKCQGSQRELILVLDDFERTEISIIELLGVINDFCENKKIKVIVVADEEKIQDVKYNEFKEKVIFNTYKLVPNSREVLSNIIANYETTENKYKSFLENHISTIYQVFNESKTSNFRSLKAILVNFERIYKLWIKKYGESVYIKDVFYTFAVTMFEYRKGNFVHGKYGYMFKEEENVNKYEKYGNNRSNLYAINEWIVKNDWDEYIILQQIDHTFYQKDIPSYEKFLMCDFWELNDELISIGLEECLILGYNGDLSFNELIYLLGRLATMKDKNIYNPVEIDFILLSEGLDLRKNKLIKEEVVEPKSVTFIENDQIKKLGKDAIALNEKIQIFRKKQKVWSIKKEVIEAIKKDDSMYMLHGKCLESFDTELCDEFYKEYIKSNNSKRNEICSLLNNLNFNYNDYSQGEDIELTIKNFDCLKEQIKLLNSKEIDSISLLINNDLIQLLNEKISELKKHLEVNENI